MSNLDGHAFIAALPELERRARSGDAEATKLLFYHLQECTSHEIPDDAELTRQVDAWYSRQPTFEQQWRMEHPRSPLPSPAHDTRREDFLQSLLDQRDRCSALTRKQIDSRLDVALMAVRRHDRDMILALAGAGSLRIEGGDLVRNADRLIELRDAERREMDRLVQEGDLDAMVRAAYGHSGRGSNLLSKDPARAYALAYARSLAVGGNGDSGMKYLMNELAEKSLSLEQVAAAAAEGDALYRRCCTGVK